MPSLSLKIVLDAGAVTRKVKFDSEMTVLDAHKVVKDKVNVPNKEQEYALFLRSADDDLSGLWLENDKKLSHYLLRDGDSLDYICRIRNLRVRLLDDTVKTLPVDEAKSVGDLMMEICARIGIKNYDEYGLCREEVEEAEDGKESKEPSSTGLTLRRPKPAKDRDVILEQMSKRLKTDDNVEWLDQHLTLREQGIENKETLLLKRRLFYSDRNVDSRDPVQLHLLYVQTRDAILQGRHPVTEQQAVNFAGMQCQIQLGDYDEKKHKTGFIEKFEEYLPEQYLNAWSVEKKIQKEYATHQGKTDLETKFMYIKTARAMPTYGVTFFLVKEKQKGKKKLVPRLLGINAEAILRLDEVTKEILQQWPLTHVKTYQAGKSQTFTLNFGDYSDKEYSVKTQDCHRIRDILEGYIDIIRRRMLAKPTADSGESMAICHDNVQMGRSHLIQHIANNPSKLVTETFVGANKLVPYEQGSQAQSGAVITTVQQIVVTDHLQNQQQALKGEMPLRGDMSKDCIKKLNRMNSNSVKIVGLLTDPTETHVKDAQQIVKTMQEDFPVVQKGVKETADKQDIEDAKKMLLDELEDLDNFMKKLAESTEPGKVNPNDAKDAAESIADLTTQMYFSIDPKTKRRSELLRRSRKSFRDGEKTEQTIRRASFVAAATTALHSVDTAGQALHEEYTGPKLDEEQKRKLEKALEDRLGKLNAAIALYLMAHSDPDNIDYSAAINSMNAINELMPKLARDAQMLASTMDPGSRKELQDEMRTLFDATKKVCGMTGDQNHEKMQEASTDYADIAGQLLYKFSHGTNADKENEIVQLAKDVGTKVSQLLVGVNELTCQASDLPAASEIDDAGVRTAGAARDLLHTAQLTAPAIHEPHCQSALTGAGTNVRCAVRALESRLRPLLEHPTRQHAGPGIHARAADVGKALDRLRDAYGNLEAREYVGTELPLQEKKRLKFITSLSGAKSQLLGVKFDEWNKPTTGSSPPSEEQKAEAQRRLEHTIAQLNAAVAALAAATADRENPDFDTAELAISTITELMPKIAKDSAIVSCDKDEATRSAMERNLCAMCDSARDMCEGDGYQHAQGQALSNFADASGKLMFLVSPRADKGKEKYIMDLSAKAHQQAGELVSNAQRVKDHVEPAAAAELEQLAHRTDDLAHAMRATAQVTAASIDEDRCRDALSSAVSKLQGSADKLTSSCQSQQSPQLQHSCAAVQEAHQELSHSLGKLAEVCQMEQSDTDGDSPAQQEKMRLKFVQSMSGAKRRLDAAAQQLTKPMACQMMTEADAAVLEKQLAEHLARLNAAVAELAAATGDRESPDYAAAEQAVNSITSLMPQVVKDSRKLCGTKTDAGQAAMLQDVRALCDATKELCDSAGQPEGLNDAAAKYTAASKNMVFHVTPGADNDKENEVIGLSADACGKASQLLSQVQRLTEMIPDAGTASELDSRGARAADAAQALLTVAQATAPTIDNTNCQKELISAAEKLRSTASDLTSSCQPHLTQHPQMKQPVLTSYAQLDDSLNKLVEACKSAQGTQSALSPVEKEKRRLKFINSLTGAKNRLYDSEQQLNQPMTKQALQPEEAAALKHRLADRLAKLHAAVAALTAAKADPVNPDYAAAEKAVKEISELMPLIVQDSRKLSGTKDAAGQAAMLDELKALCQASRSICENSETNPKVNTTDFNKAASKLVFLVSPADKTKKKQVMELSDDACKKATQLLSQVNSLSDQLTPEQAGQLSLHGAMVKDAADTLHEVAYETRSSKPLSVGVVSSAEILRLRASELATSCAPHLAQRPELQQQVLSSTQQLADSLDKLVNACKLEHSGNLVDVPAQQQEKQRLKFISSVTGAKGCLDDAERQLKEPMVCQMMKQEDGAALERKLSDRLARLNAAVAALAAATADREHPNYEAADRAVRTISELMPQLVQESRTLCGTKTDKEQAAMLQDLRALVEASRQICDSAGHTQGLSDATAKFSAASGKLVYIVSPKAQDVQEKQVLALSATSCGKAGELLSQVQRLTEMIPDAGTASELDSRGARAADAAQALLTVAQATAPTIEDPHCQKELISAAEKLRNTASELTSSCQPHLDKHPEMKQQVLSSQGQLVDSLEKLIQACKIAQPGTGVLSPQQEKQRITFVSSVSGAKKHLDTAEQQMKKPVISQKPNQGDSATLQDNLSRALAQLNVAVAALAAATQDAKNPDYPAAERAVITITQLVPQIVQDSRSLCGTKEAAGQAAMLGHLRDLCDASRAICDSAGQPKKLNEASAKLANASSKLLYIVSPEGTPGSKPAVPARKAPPPTPVRDPKHTVAQPVRSSVHTDSTKDFLDTLRLEESKAGVGDNKALAAYEEDKRAYKQFCEMIDSAEKGLETAQDQLKVLHKAKTSTAGKPLPAVEVARREQHMEDSLARAGVHAAALVAANYADKLDYKAAIDPTISLIESVKTVVNDGSAVYSALPEHTRKPFVDDMTGLCQATKSICDAAKSKEEVKKLNNAAISFGDQSVKLLRVVSCKVDPALEAQVISRAKSIGDTASRLALEAGTLAASVAPPDTPDTSDTTDTSVAHICTAGARCVDAAGKLAYTAKLIAPTIHHAICQDTLISSADNLSSSLTKFSKTWAPLASSQQPSVHKLTQEAGHLEDLVERLRKDVKAGKLGKTKTTEQIVNLDSPLRKMTMQIIETAKSMAEYGEMSTEQRKEYIKYSDRLEDAVRSLDLANARYQRAPHDKNKQEELEIATQDLQMELLQTRPSRAGQEQNNIVDFRDFLQDLMKEAGELQSAAKKYEGAAGKRTTDDIKILSSKISEDASRLLNPPDTFGDGVTVMNTVDDIMDIDVFGQECDVMVKEINGAIQGIHDQKAKQALRAKALPLTESCHLLRFAVHSHIMATKSLALDEALKNLDHVQKNVLPPLAKEVARKSQNVRKMTYCHPLGALAPAGRARARVLCARVGSGLGAPGTSGGLPAALTHYALATATVSKHHPVLPVLKHRAEDTDPVQEPQIENRYIDHLSYIAHMTNNILTATPYSCQLHEDIDTQARTLLKELNSSEYIPSLRKTNTPVYDAEDIDKLLLCKREHVSGTPKQLEDKLHQLSTKLSSTSGTVVLSVKRPDSLARSLHAAADTAAQLANTARALKDHKKPVQCHKIEEASHEMCLATYSLLKTSELVCQDPNHHDARRKLLDACRHLNDSINKLVRSVKPADRVNQECGEVLRSLQVQRSLLQASPQPSAGWPYDHCVDTLKSQRDVLLKLNSDQAMSREEFLKSLHFVVSAVNNSTESAAQAAYLISVSEKDESIGKEGIVDVAKLHKAVGAVEESCVSIVMATHEEQVQEETAALKVQVQDLLQGIDDSTEKTKDGELKDMLKQCRKEISSSSGALFKGVAGNPNDKEGIISKVMDLMDDVNDASSLIEHPDLVPVAGEVSAETQQQVDEVVKSSLALLTNTEELVKQVKSAPEEPEVMKWVMFNKRKDVLDAFENLLKNVKTSGQRLKLIEGSADDSENEKKSYVQKQFDAASRWLDKPVSKPEVKTNGQQAVRNLIGVAHKIAEDLQGSDKEDMRTLMKETEQLLTECTKKYDHEQYSALMERVRELKKGIERGVVTRVVQDFMDAEAPLADLDLVADYEQDESKRKFLLEKKIAELLAQLSRVTKTARLIADTDKDAGTTISTQLNSCSEQAELLAPMLVKAAQQRVASPDNKAVIDNYKSLLARYAESLSKIRDLCDQSVDPMDFVQTAGETMERMREESTKHNDPMKCAHTSAAITKLANRVIHVSMSSSSARSDPELQKALIEAKQQLAAATPPEDTRASRLPDWKDTTAKILQATGEVESILGGDSIFRTQPGPDQPIYNEALNLHVAIRDWSSRDNEIVAVAKRMAVLMAKLSNYMTNDKQREVLATSKSIVTDSHEVARLAKKLAHECTDHRIKTNLLQTCERIPTISGQLKMLTTVKGFSLGRHGTQEDKEALDMLVGNAQSLMLSIQDVVKGAASASVKIMSQRGPRMKWVRKTVY